MTQVLFGFWNGELYRIVVAYEPDLTEGMTDADMIEALSPPSPGCAPAGGWRPAP